MNFARTNNPKWLTVELLQKDNGDIIFKNENNRDFKEFSGFDFGLKKISDLINETLKNKKLVIWKPFNDKDKSKTVRVIYIKKEYFEKMKIITN